MASILGKTSKPASDNGQLDYDFENFFKYAGNKHLVGDYPRKCSDAVIKVLSCFMLRSRFDRMVEAAKRHTKQELDIAQLILKQRMLTNAVWGLTTPFQRRLCRH